MCLLRLTRSRSSNDHSDGTPNAWIFVLDFQRRRAEVWSRLEESDGRGDADSVIWVGQSAGLVDSVLPAGEVVTRIAAEAEEMLREPLPGFVSN
jgi:hypothetical protein